MTQLKLLFLGLITTASLNIKADVMSGYLDLSNLYGKTDAGRYFLSLALDTDKTAVLDINRSLSAAPGDEPWTEPKVCLTDLNVIAGKATLILADVDKDESKTVIQTVRLYSSHYDESENCSSIEQILEKGITFTAYINMGTVSLNRKAPYDYDKLESYISIFPYGYSVTLQFKQVAKGRYVATDLKSQLSSQVKRGNKEALSYYIYAAKEQTTLSLGQGFIELK